MTRKEHDQQHNDIFIPEMLMHWWDVAWKETVDRLPAIGLSNMFSLTKSIFFSLCSFFTIFGLCWWRISKGKRRPCDSPLLIVYVMFKRLDLSPLQTWPICGSVFVVLHWKRHIKAFFSDFFFFNNYSTLPLESHNACYFWSTLKNRTKVNPNFMQLCFFPSAFVRLLWDLRDFYLQFSHFIFHRGNNNGCKSNMCFHVKEMCFFEKKCRMFGQQLQIN